VDNLPSLDSMLNFNAGMNMSPHVDMSMETPSDRLEHMGMNPFVGVEVQGGGGMGTPQPMNVDASRMSATFDNGNTSSGPPMVTKRSPIGQMIDPRGQAVSQHVILLDSMIRSISDCMTSYKNMTEALSEVAKRQIAIYRKLVEKKILTEDEGKDAKSFVTTYEAMAREICRKMEEAAAITKALPNVVEGDRGIYEHESQPSAPLMRRPDGSTMKDPVFGSVTKSAGMSSPGDAPTNVHTAATAGPPSSGAGSRTGPASTNLGMSMDTDNSGFNPFQPTTDLSVDGSMVTSGHVDLTTTTSMDTVENASNIISLVMDEVMNDATTRETNFGTCLLEVMVPTAGGETSMFDCICTVVGEYMSVNAGKEPPRDQLVAMLEEMGSPSNMSEVTPMMRDWIRNTTTAMQMFEFFSTDEE